MAPDRNLTLRLRRDFPNEIQRCPKLSGWDAALPNRLRLPQVFHLRESPPLARRAGASVRLPIFALSRAPSPDRSTQDPFVRPFGSHQHPPPANAPAPASRTVPAADRRWRISKTMPSDSSSILCSIT